MFLYFQLTPNKVVLWWGQKHCDVVLKWFFPSSAYHSGRRSRRWSPPIQKHHNRDKPQYLPRVFLEETEPPPSSVFSHFSPKFRMTVSLPSLLLSLNSLSQSCHWVGNSSTNQEVCGHVAPWRWEHYDASKLRDHITHRCSIIPHKNRYALPQQWHKPYSSSFKCPDHQH